MNHGVGNLSHPGAAKPRKSRQRGVQPLLVAIVSGVSQRIEKRPFRPFSEFGGKLGSPAGDERRGCGEKCVKHRCEAALALLDLSRVWQNNARARLEARYQCGVWFAHEDRKPTMLDTPNRDVDLHGRAIGSALQPEFPFGAPGEVIHRLQRIDVQHLILRAVIGDHAGEWARIAGLKTGVQMNGAPSGTAAFSGKLFRVDWFQGANPCVWTV
jgi:hypothetical protein